MSEILPFKGVHFTDKAGNIQDLITQPYDKITPEMQENYYKRSEYNSIRFVLGKEQTGDNDTCNKYTRARNTFQQFLKKGILTMDDEPAIYAYDQEYVHPDSGKIVTRKCYIGALKLHEYEENIVYPHEHTLSGPKDDRLNLTRAMEANTGLVLMFYRDNEFAVQKILEENTKSEPLFDAVDHFNTHHKIWKITDKKVISTIQKAMEGKTYIVCDGHHRYETALNYRNEMRHKNPGYSGREAWNYRMVAFANSADPALFVYPTHRVIRNVDGFNDKKLLERLGEKFNIETVEPKCCPETTVVELAGSVKRDAEKHAFGLYIQGDERMYKLTLKDESIAKQLPGDMSDDWKTLDVTILHKIILEPMLGIGEKELAEQSNVDYIRHFDESVKLVSSGSHQCAFFMNPTLTHHVEAVTKHNETMPQKSTDYFPKVQSGLVLQYIPDNEEI
jgi:uncharacterized protein (DUF1015 family)